MEKKVSNFAVDYDEITKKQFEDCINQDFVIKASLMPDAHVGYVAPIGSVLLTKQFVVPAWVGYDIGCGLIAVKFSNKNIDLIEKVNEKSFEIFKKIRKYIPMGKGVYNKKENLTDKTIKDFKQLLTNFKKKENYNKDDYNQISADFCYDNLGSLGSGNHFIEIGKSNKNNDLWLVIHCGSRKIGHNIATKYMILAQKINKEKGNYEQTCPLNVNSKEGQDYINIVNFLLDYALLNRLEISYNIHKILEEVLDVKLDYELWTNKNHNHVVFEEEIGKGSFIHRKGATPAKKGERGIIPGNMADGSYLVEGIGNEKFLFSSSHGAGRSFSRKEAKKNISIQEFEKSVQNIVCLTGDKFIDEAPKAYKNIDKVMQAQKKSIEIKQKITPLINCKG